jgi:MSHA biogenesis protein MshO
MPTFIFRKSAGFTLIELILVIVLIGILAAIGGLFIVHPIEGYTDLARRTELVDSADTALRRMQRDIRLALPNSVRVSGSSLEILETVDGGRYRAQVDSSNPAANGNILDFTSADSSFQVLGALNGAPPAGSSVDVYNFTNSGTQGNDYSAYANGTEATIGSVTSPTSASPTINLASGVNFPFSSPYQRFFIVAGPVSYVCDTGSGSTHTLKRYSGYTPARDTNTSVSSMGTGVLMANHISGCIFSYAPGTTQRAGLVTLQLTLTDSGETITLLHQVHVENAP